MIQETPPKTADSDLNEPLGWRQNWVNRLRAPLMREEEKN